MQCQCSLRPSAVARLIWSCLGMQLPNTELLRWSAHMQNDSPIYNSAQLSSVVHSIALATAVADSPRPPSRDEANLTLSQWWQHGSSRPQRDVLCCEDVIIGSPAAHVSLATKLTAEQGSMLAVPYKCCQLKSSNPHQQCICALYQVGVLAASHAAVMRYCTFAQAHRQQHQSTVPTTLPRSAYLREP